MIRASAGTGKTYQLSNRFLGLVAAEEPFDTILATTFTRKAAGEILDRVLLRLAEAALDPAKRTRLAADLGRPQLDRDCCLRRLASMVRRLHRLRVSTLDSFFIEVAHSFSLELGLPPGWQIVDEIDDGRLRTEAIRSVLQDQSTGDVLQLMHLLTKGEAARSVSEQIRQIVDELYSLYLEAPPSAWDALPRSKQLEPEELAGALDALAAAELPPDKRFAKARDDNLAAAQDGDWPAFLAKGFVKKLVAGEDRFYNKPIPPAVREACELLVRHAGAVLLGQIASQTLATRRLLDHFDAAYQRLKLSQRWLRFEDVTRRLSASSLADRPEEVVFRLDSHIAHLLLDEFQDTSPLQWRVLQPFARRAVAPSASGSFFCVGDVKQAIYGWRGGAAEIFDALEEEISGLASQPLNRSYRSSPVVIETVNRVFARLESNPALARHAQAAARWAARFQEHATTRSDLPGYCRMIAGPAVQTADDGSSMAQFAAEEVAKLRAAAPGFTIGVLVRRNAAVARLIYELRHRHVDASEEGGNPLTDSAAVRLILSLLSLADHPGHSAARFHVARSPLGPELGLTDVADHAAAWRLAQSVRRRLLDEGYGRTIYDWVRRLAPHCDARELARLLQLVELAYGCQSRATLRADDFIALVENRRVESPTSAPVRVMTVHQAKGLEFDVVVLPELHAQFSGQPPQMVAGRPGPARPIDCLLRYVNQDLRPLLPPRLARIFEEHECRVAEEALCVLYVALTRAVHALHLIVPASADNEASLHGTAAGLLRAALTDGSKLEPGAVPFETGDPQWFRAFRPAGAEVPLAPPRPPLVVRLRPPARSPERGLQRCGPSELEAGSRVDLARRLRLASADALNRGGLMHSWFERIQWLDEGPLDEQDLRQSARAFLPADANVDAILADFRAALTRPAVRAVLTRSTFQTPCTGRPESAVHAGPHVARPQWKVWRERPFALREEDLLLAGKIDRLVVLYDGDIPVGTDVIDFKTDVIPADDAPALAARVEVYRPQLEAYRRAAVRLSGLPEDRVVARLVFTEPGIVRLV